jgi:hypothetical protein
MYGRRFFGGSYFGDAFFGDGGSSAPPGASAAQIWAYVLGNGLSAGATLSAVHALLLELHQVHGLESGSPLTVTTTSRTAAAISQTIAEVAGTVTVTRD